MRSGLVILIAHSFPTACTTPPLPLRVLISPSLCPILIDRESHDRGGAQTHGLEDIAHVYPGPVNQALLLRHEYMVTENCIRRNEIQGRVRLSDGELQIANLLYRLCIRIRV
jgi:hypothetical protein